MNIFVTSIYECLSFLNFPSAYLLQKHGTTAHGSVSKTVISVAILQIKQSLMFAWYVVGRWWESENDAKFHRLSDPHYFSRVA